MRASGENMNSQYLPCTATLFRIVLAIASGAGLLPSAEGAEPAEAASSQPTSYSRESRVVFYAASRQEEATVVYRARSRAMCVVTFDNGQIVSTEEQHHKIGASESQVEQAEETRALTATYRYELSAGERPGFPTGRIEIGLEQPYVGFELFFLPRQVLGMKESMAGAGIVRLTADERVIPRFSGAWTFSIIPLSKGAVRVEGPVVLRSDGAAISLAGYYAKDVELTPLRITRMKGAYLITVSDPEEQRRFLGYAHSAGQNTANLRHVDALNGHFEFEMKRPLE